jgi:hypothetical protein
LWIITILGVLSVAVARYLSTEVRLTRYRLARHEARELARSGVYLAIQRLEQDRAEGVDWLEDDWAFAPVAPWVVSLAEDESAQEANRVEISIADEERRLDLNGPLATPALLAQLTGASEIGQPIIDYRDPPEPEVEDQPEVPYFAKNDPIRALAELLDIPAVRTLTEENPKALTTLFEQATVYTEGRINANTASEAMLLAVRAGAVPPGLIRAFVEKRGAGPDGELGGGDDCLLAAGANNTQDLADCLETDPATVGTLVSGLDYRSAVFRIVAKGIVKRPFVQYQVEAIVRRSDNPATPSTTILAWRES